MDLQNGWDSHVHAFGPIGRYAVLPERGYDPPDALVTDYRAQSASAGIGHCVWVQPSIYGADNGALLDALAASDGRDRAVVAPAPDWDARFLAQLHARGVRGLRLNLTSQGGNDAMLIRPLAPTLRELGWHVAALLDVTEPGLLTSVLADLDLPLVVDHFGRPPHGVVDPVLDVFGPLLRAVESGRVWVKLSAAYQISKLPPPWPDMAPLARALFQAGGDRILFASNWPHVGGQDVPRLADLVAIAATWAQSVDADPKLIFHDNPATLYS